MYAPYPYSSAGLQITKADNGWIVQFQEPYSKKSDKIDLNTPSMSDFVERDDDEDEYEEEWDQVAYPHGTLGLPPVMTYKTYVFTQKEELMKFISERV